MRAAMTRTLEGSRGLAARNEASLGLQAQDASVPPAPLQVAYSLLGTSTSCSKAHVSLRTSNVTLSAGSFAGSSLGSRESSVYE